MNKTNQLIKLNGKVYQFRSKIVAFRRKALRFGLAALTLLNSPVGYAGAVLLAKGATPIQGVQPATYNPATALPAYSRSLFPAVEAVTGQAPNPALSQLLNPAPAPSVASQLFSGTLPAPTLASKPTNKALYAPAPLSHLPAFANAKVVPQATLTKQVSQVVFIDSAVPDAQSLIDGIVKQQAANATAQASVDGQSVRLGNVLLIHLGDQPLEQMQNVLSKLHNLDGIQVISHGDKGELKLGSTVLDGQNLAQYATQVKAWGTALKSSGDILLYGCRVAADGTGQQFVDQIAKLTGADVAASTDTTGNKLVGANWTLEDKTGPIAVAGIINDATAPQWRGVLAAGNWSITATGPVVEGAPSNITISYDGTLKPGESTSVVLTPTNVSTDNADYDWNAFLDAINLAVDGTTTDPSATAPDGTPADGMANNDPRPDLKFDKATATLTFSPSYIAQTSGTLPTTNNIPVSGGISYQPVDMTGYTDYNGQSVAGGPIRSGSLLLSAPTSIALPQPFYFYGVPYTYIAFNEDGYARLGTDSSIAAGAVVPGTFPTRTQWNGRPAIYYQGADFNWAQNPYLHYLVLPDGRMAFEIKDAFGGLNTNTNTVQLVLDFATGNITINYIDSNVGTGLGSVTSGVNTGVGLLQGDTVPNSTVDNTYAKFMYDETIIPSGTTVKFLGDSQSMQPLTVALPTIDDTEVEKNEQLDVTLGGVTGVLGGATSTAIEPSNTASLVILDNDVPIVSIGNAPDVNEGGNLVYPITLSKTAPFNITIPVTYTGTASDGTDYTSVANVTIPAGQTTGTLTVTTATDATAETTETVVATINNDTAAGGGGYTVSTTAASGTGNILDVPPVVTISATTATAAEGSNLVYTLTLDKATSQDITVPITYAGTATNGADYTGVTNVTIPAGQTTATLTIPTLTDAITPEADETVIASIGTGTGYTVGATSQATGTITDVATAQPPAAPTAAPDMTATTDTGASNTDNVTSDTTPSFTVAAPPTGMTSVLYVDGVQVPATFDAATNTLTPTTPLTEGAHSITTAVQDTTSGLISAQSPALSATIDTTAPAAPAAPTSYGDNVGGVQSATSTATTTDDSTPSLNIGTGLTDTPSLYVDGVKVPATYDPVKGTLTPTTPLGDGTHNLSYTLTDAAGNESAQSAALPVTVDTTAPSAPTATVTNPTTVTGTGTPGDTVTITTPDGTVVTATVQPDGTYTATLPTVLTPGQAVSVTETDPAGNTSAATPATYNPNAPTAPTAAPDMTATTDTGASNTDNVTSDTTPSFTVAAPPTGTTPVLYVDGVQVPATFDATTNTLTPTTPLTEGAHSITTAVQDTTSGLVSGQSPALSATIDTTPPATPAAPTSYADNIGPVQSTTSTATTTDDATPGLNIGTGLTDTPSLYVDGVKVPATYDPVTGTLTPNTPLTDGQHSLTYTLTDPAGNESPQSAPLPLNIVAGAPAAPTTAPDMTAATDTGSSNTDNNTSDTTPTFAVTVPAGTTPVLYVDGQPVDATYDAAAGTLTPTVPLTEGNHAVSYGLVNTATGGASQPGPALAVAIDTTPPATPTAPSTYTDNVGPVQSPASNEAVTDDNTPGLNIGKWPADVTPSLYVDGVKVPASYDPATGTLTPNTPLPDGQHNLTYTLTDPAGNESAQSAPLKLTVDTQAPTTPTATISTDGKAVTGTAEPGSTVTVTLPDGTKVQTTADSNGNYTVTLPTPLDNNQGVTVTATDAAGNTSPTAQDTYTAPVPAQPTASVPNDVTVTGTAQPGSTVTVTLPDGTKVQTTADSSGNYTVTLPTPLNNGDIVTVTQTVRGQTSQPAQAMYTNPAAPTATVAQDAKTVTGNAVPGSTVTIKDAQGNVIGTTTANPDGSYSYTLPTPLKNGESVTVTQTVNSVVSAPTTATFRDTTPPAQPVGTVAQDGKTITGSAEPGSTVTVTLPDGTKVQTTADGNGNFTVTLPTPLKPGESVGITATDAAGNLSQPGQVTYTDTTPPAQPVGTVAQDGKTITGTAEPGSKVTVTAPDGTKVETTADANGNYTVTLPTPLTSGQAVTIVATDPSGNASQPGQATYTDTVAPTATISTDGKTITGTAEPGSTVTVTLPDGTKVPTTADSNGNYTVTLPTPLNPGQSVTVTATDAAGNTSLPTAKTYNPADTTAPTAPTATINAAGTQVTGQAEPGSTVTVKDAQGNVIGTATADANGNYTVTLTRPLAPGETIGVTATDGAGNVSQPTEKQYVVTPPPTPTATGKAQKYVRNVTTQTAFGPQVDVLPGDKLQYCIAVQTLAGISTGIKINDLIPAGTVYGGNLIYSATAADLTGSTLAPANAALPQGATLTGNAQAVSFNWPQSGTQPAHNLTVCFDVTVK